MTISFTYATKKSVDIANKATKDAVAIKQKLYNPKCDILYLIIYHIYLLFEILSTYVNIILDDIP